MFGTFAAPVVIIERRQAAERICISYPNPWRVWVCGTAPPRLLCPCVRSTCSLLAPIVRPTGQRSRGPPSRRGLRRGIAWERNCLAGWRVEIERIRFRGRKSLESLVSGNFARNCHDIHEETYSWHVYHRSDIARRPARRAAEA
jgi:hypothetical protein